MPFIRKQYRRIESLEDMLKKENETLKTFYDKANDLLDLAMTKRHTLRNGFTVSQRAYHEVQITDKKAFFNWLKANCDTDEIINLLSPPCTKKDLKTFVDTKINDAIDPAFKIDGVEANVKIYKIHCGYKKEKRR